MRIERLEKRASEKELIAGLPSSNKDASFKEHGHAELLRSRIAELNRRLAILNSDLTSLVLPLHREQKAQLGGRRSKQHDP